MLEQIFVEFPGRVFHAPRGDDASGNCSICAEISEGKEVLGAVSPDVLVLKARYPYVPGHLLIVPRAHFSDLSRVGSSVGDAFFEALRNVSERLGGKYWLVANVGWVAGQSVPHFAVHVLPDPWHVPDDFTEQVDRLPTFDPLTDVFTDKLRFKKFYVRYGGAHMSGLVVSDFHEFKRAISKLRAKFGRMRNVLHHERVAMLERGHVPHVGYHLLVVNYNGPQFVVIPRVFVPKRGRWAALELLYNADLSRDLEGDAATEFFGKHNSAVAELARLIFK